MDIKGKITGIKYKVFLSDNLPTVSFNQFNINTAPSSCIVQKEQTSFAISKWVSPKRTRSYPYERVYNTLSIAKKITVIPIVKDEGAKGDRDFIQWDTVSLMSLLDVFVIFAYYTSAEAKGAKITNQQFDNDFVNEKIKEIESYHSSALHWNLNELTVNFGPLLQKVRSSYLEISKITGVRLHKIDGIDRFARKITGDVENFKLFSRDKAHKAQKREFTTVQPKESLSTLSKAKITIANYLGGLYFFTVDEIQIIDSHIYLIEGKYSTDNILPSRGDIKDGLLKMILYSNLSDVTINDQVFTTRPILDLVSNKIKFNILSDFSVEELQDLYIANDFNKGHLALIETIFKEAQENNFTIRLRHP